MFYSTYVSHADVYTKFLDFLKELEGRPAKFEGDVGGYFLDVGHYGYIVCRTVDSGGRVECPLGTQRRGGQSMIEALEFATAVLRLMHRHDV